MTKDLYAKFEDLMKNNVIGGANDTNILDVIHLSENDHTNILWQILCFRKDDEYPYMKSFFKNVLNLRYDNYFSVNKPLQPDSGTQYQAIPMASKQKADKGNDAKGFIDLLLKGEDSVVIVENKVCGAGDSDNQLVRYYHSFVELNQTAETADYYDEIQSAYGKYHDVHKEEYGNREVFVVYLTKDGKEPDAKSIHNLQTQIGDHFIQIAYFSGDENHKSILDWLKEDVLPNICYLEGGHLLQSVLIYIDYLENTLLGSESTDEYTSDIRYRDIFRGCSVSDLIKEYRDNATKLVNESDVRGFAYQYAKCLTNFINMRINELLSKETFFEGWHLHWRAAWFMIYKKEWNKYGTGRVINLVHWEMLKNMDSTPDYQWSFHMEGRKLADLAKLYEPEWQSIFNGKKINGSGQIQKISDFGMTRPAYIFDSSDKEIVQYFGELFNNIDFTAMTNQTEAELDKRFLP